jgi:large subunit ribosomal protein L35
MANKMKTRKSAVARFKITKNGKILRRRNFTSHLKAKKSSKRLRNLKKQVLVNPTYAKRLRKALGITLKDKSKAQSHHVMTK